MFFRSIRFRMILWYMLLLTLTLLSFSSALYGSFRGILYNDLDDLLSSRAEGIVSSINTYKTANLISEAQDRSKPEVFASMAGDWVKTNLKDPELMRLSVRITDSNGQVVASSKNMPNLDLLMRDILEDVLEGEDSFDTVRGDTAEKNKTRLRVYTRPVSEDGNVKYIIQVASSLELLTLATKNLILILFVILPLTVVLAGVPGLILVRLTLKPIDDMINTIKRTTAENLKLKIHLPDTKDEIKRLADTFNDMIERLDRSFSSQQSFIQDISAELKTPMLALREDFKSVSNRLASVQVTDGAALTAPSAQVTGGAALTAPSVQECAVILKRGIEEMNRFESMIKELETLAKFDNDRMVLEIRKVDLRRLLEEVLADAKTKACNKDIDMSSVLKDAIVLDGDEKQIKLLFSNLLDNAIKYTNRKGRINISARKNHRSAFITVTDTGIGIEDAELPYIFDRFYQVKKSHFSSGSFGLGLSIAKSVADVHKGAISIDSKTGKGSAFTVSLPLSYSG